MNGRHAEREPVEMPSHPSQPSRADAGVLARFRVSEPQGIGVAALLGLDAPVSGILLDGGILMIASYVCVLLRHCIAGALGDSCS